MRNFTSVFPLRTFHIQSDTNLSVYHCQQCQSPNKHKTQYFNFFNIYEKNYFFCKNPTQKKLIEKKTKSPPSPSAIAAAEAPNSNFVYWSWEVPDVSVAEPVVVKPESKEKELKRTWTEAEWIQGRNT